MKYSPYEAMCGCSMKLGLANSVLPRNWISNMAIEEDNEKIRNINNECMVNSED